MIPIRQVAARFTGIPPGCVWHPVANAGFSGALVWRGEIEAVPAFALKRWPMDYPLDRLQDSHRWMIQAKHLPFVPWLASNPAVEVEGHLWDLCSWMPGEPAPPSGLTGTTLHAACSAIFQLHGAWKPARPTFGVCPAVVRRLELFSQWDSTHRSPGTNGIWGEAQAVVREGLPAARWDLLNWLPRAVPLQPCLADIHREHVLFTGDAVTGIIDYGAMKIDNVAVDAARFLGDAADGGDGLFQLGCELFSRHHGEADCPPTLVEVLDRTGTLGAIAHWVLRGERAERIELRLARLIERSKRIQRRAA